MGEDPAGGGSQEGSDDPADCLPRQEVGSLTGFAITKVAASRAGSVLLKCHYLGEGGANLTYGGDVNNKADSIGESQRVSSAGGFTAVRLDGFGTGAFIATADSPR